MSLIRFVSGAAMATVVGLVSSLAASTAHALPVSGKCSITTYYSDASMTTKVGSFSTCPGQRGLTGVRTKFFEVDEFQIGEGPRPKPPGTKPLPCEFLVNCNPNLPIAR